MYRALGFSFTTRNGLILFIVLLVIFVFSYHSIIQQSIRNHPESTLLAVQEHCRYMLGKQIGKIPNDELAAALQRCNDIRLKSVEAAGGVFDPVIIKVTIEAQHQPPLDKTVFIFKSAAIHSGVFNLVSSLNCLISGHWNFNFYNTYSNTMFHGSF